MRTSRGTWRRRRSSSAICSSDRRPFPDSGGYREYPLPVPLTACGKNRWSPASPAVMRHDRPFRRMRPNERSKSKIAVQSNACEPCAFGLRRALHATGHQARAPVRRTACPATPGWPCLCGAFSCCECDGWATKSWWPPGSLQAWPQGGSGGGRKGRVPGAPFSFNPATIVADGSSG
jgi:hypothetical protein